MQQADLLRREGGGEPPDRKKERHADKTRIMASSLCFPPYNRLPNALTPDIPLLFKYYSKKLYSHEMYSNRICLRVN
jgi:hypothetical protein